MFVSFNVNEKPRTTLSHSPKFQFLKCRFSLTNSSPKEPKIRHRCRHFEHYSAARLLFHDVILSKRFCPYGLPLWIMAALEPYYFKPNMLQTPKMIAVRIVKWIIAWKKIHFGDFVKDAKSVAGFSASRQFRVGRNDHINTAWLPSTVFEWRPLKSNYGLLSRRISSE